MSVRRDVGASVVWGSDMAQKGDFRGGVFISYRRVPSAADAKMLSEILESRLTRRRVFFDERIPKGADFPDEIEAALKRAHLVLIVIAPEWANDIHAREQNPSVDWVRREVAITQARRSAADPPEVRVVLVGGALMPAEHELPEDLRWLASINAYSAPRDWHSEQTWIDEFLAEIVAMILISSVIPSVRGAPPGVGRLSMGLEGVWRRRGGRGCSARGQAIGLCSSTEAQLPECCLNPCGHWRSWP